MKSGVHATLAGVALAFMIPLSCKTSEGRVYSMSKEMERGLHYWVAFFILPLFAFVNAGVDLRGIYLAEIFNPVPMGIMPGLFVDTLAYNDTQIYHYTDKLAVLLGSLFS